jgi:NAD(P)-dependent dehydrogenase (short-subunit alcohol dehydrogenase family)
MNIHQKVVIVTGSGGGIGEGIAKHFAAHGAKVLVNDVNNTAGQKVVKDIQAAGGTAAFFAASWSSGEGPLLPVDGPTSAAVARASIGIKTRLLSV